MTLAGLAALGVRCLLVVLFLPFSALDKVFGFKSAVKQAQRVFPHPLSVVMILVGLAVEIFCSLGVVTGVTLALVPAYALRQDVYLGLSWSDLA